MRNDGLVAAIRRRERCTEKDDEFAILIYETEPDERPDWAWCDRAEHRRIAFRERTSLYRKHQHLVDYVARAMGSARR